MDYKYFNKYFKPFSTVIFLFALIWFAYGAISFRGSPIKECGEDRYCGKQGQVYSKSDYENYLTWFKGLTIITPLALLIGMFSNWIDRKANPMIKLKPKKE